MIAGAGPKPIARRVGIIDLGIIVAVRAAVGALVTARRWERITDDDLADQLIRARGKPYWAGNTRSTTLCYR
jgi:hypothetical protein